MSEIQPSLFSVSFTTMVPETQNRLFQITQKAEHWVFLDCISHFVMYFWARDKTSTIASAIVLSQRRIL